MASNVGTKPPTGKEPFTPVRIRSTSATERSKFRSCRREWFLGVVHRLGGVQGNDNFIFGTAIHAGLAAYYQALIDGSRVDFAEEKALLAWREDWSTALTQVRSDLGFLWAQYEQGYEDMAAMGDVMLEGYFQQERLTPIGRPTAVEQRFEVPIKTSGGMIIGYLSCQLDLQVEQPGNGRPAISDHKTAASAPNSGQLDLDDQLTAYLWARWRILEEFTVKEAIYNVLLKKMPHPPRLLKSGKLSVDKSQTTTLPLFRQAIEENGLQVNDYAEHLAWLADEGPKLFHREGVFRTRGQLASFEDNLFHEFVDMRNVAKRPELAYPNPSPFRCPSCPVRAICQTMMDQDDVEAVIRDNFVILPPRREE